jgi:hypothetical protein
MTDFRIKLNEIFPKLSPVGQQQFLAQLVAQLTLMGRSTYDLSEGVSNPKLLRDLNEAQNRLAAQLVAILFDDSRRYPDDVFANIISDNFVSLGLDEVRANDLIQASTKRITQSP